MKVSGMFLVFIVLAIALSMNKEASGRCNCNPDCNLDCSGQSKNNTKTLCSPQCHCGYCGSEEHYQDCECIPLALEYPGTEMCSFNHTFGEAGRFVPCEKGKCCTYGVDGAPGQCCDGKNEHPPWPTESAHSSPKPTSSVITEETTTYTETIEPTTQSMINRTNQTHPSTDNVTAINETGHTENYSWIAWLVVGILIVAGIGIGIYCRRRCSKTSHPSDGADVTENFLQPGCVTTAAQANNANDHLL